MTALRHFETPLLKTPFHPRTEAAWPLRLWRSVTRLGPVLPRGAVAPLVAANLPNWGAATPTVEVPPYAVSRSVPVRPAPHRDGF
jgi:hypothetical protein